MHEAGEILTSESPEVQEPQIRPFRSRLDYLLACYLDTTDYIQREKNRQWALDQSTKAGLFPRDEAELRYPAVFTEHKEELVRKLHQELKKNPDYKWLKEWPGVGPVAAALLLSKVNIEKADSPSKLWKFCGLMPGQRLVKGQKRDYNAKLKTVVLHYIGQMTLLRTEPWKTLLATSKQFYAAKYPEWSKGHVHNAARRRMVKIYLTNLWRAWRKAHGLSIREPFAIARLGHTGNFQFDPAMVEETPIVSERAIKPETPTAIERAKTQKTPTSPERAIAKETPIPHERARETETPMVPERATNHETPIAQERARAAETPINAERAIEQETSIPDERAMEIKTPIELERYEIPEEQFACV